LPTLMGFLCVFSNQQSSYVYTYLGKVCGMKYLGQGSPLIWIKPCEHLQWLVLFTLSYLGFVAISLLRRWSTGPIRSFLQISQSTPAYRVTTNLRKHSTKR
jgi:hypothetical protein